MVIISSGHYIFIKCDIDITKHDFLMQIQSSCKSIFCATNLSFYTFSVFRPILSQIHHSVYPSMHAVSHSLTGHAHQAPPATQTCAHWQPYSTIQSFSAYSSPTSYLHTPASSVPSASPTPQAIRSHFFWKPTLIIISPNVNAPVNFSVFGLKILCFLKYDIGFTKHHFSKQIQLSW